MTDIVEMMNQERALSLDQAKILNEVIEAYPYFQMARVLQLKALHNSHSFFYNSALKKTAAYTTDRSILFDFITSDRFLQHDIATRIKERKSSIRKQSAEIMPEKRDILLMDEDLAAQVLDPDIFQEETKETSSEENTEEEAETSTIKKDDHLKRFESGQLHSFSEWLKFAAVKPVELTDEADLTPKTEAESEERQRRIAREQDIIDKFIEASPKIIPTDTKPTLEIPKQNYGLEDRLMTETLAEIYVEQNKYDKAIQAYRILILKNPEKSGLFADRIYQIEKLKEK